MSLTSFERNGFSVREKKRVEFCVGVWIDRPVMAVNAALKLKRGGIRIENELLWFVYKLNAPRE